MVNSNSFKQVEEYNTYYRPSLDDIDFIPSQGVKPLYKYQYSYLKGTIPPVETIYLLQHEEISTTDYYLLINLFIIWILLYLYLKFKYFIY